MDSSFNYNIYLTKFSFNNFHKHRDCIEKFLALVPHLFIMFDIHERYCEYFFNISHVPKRNFHTIYYCYLNENYQVYFISLEKFAECFLYTINKSVPMDGNKESSEK